MTMYTCFNKKRLPFLFIIISVLGLGLVTGCVKEDLDACYQVVIKVVNLNGDEITGSGEVSHATLFVFDHDSTFLESVAVDRDAIVNKRPVVLDYPVDRPLHLVAFGGTVPLETKQEVPQLTGADKMSDLKVRMKESNSIAVPPDDLFSGVEDVTISKSDFRTYEVVIRKKVTKVIVRTEGFSHIPTKAVEGYSFRVLDVPGGFDYQGKGLEETAVYNPDYRLITEKNVLLSDTSNVVPDKRIYAEFTRPDGTTDRVEADDENEPFIPKLGENLTIVFVYGPNGTLSCRTEVTPWGTGDDQNIEF